MRDRIETIDISKGIAICAIVLGHVSTGFLWDTTLIFATAAFFLLSGFTFYIDRDSDGYLLWNKEAGFGDFIKKAAGRLLFPYALWGVISIAIYLVFGKLSSKVLGLPAEHMDILSNLKGLIYANSDSGYFEWNRPLWFLPCLFIVELIAFMILWLTRNNEILQITTAIITVIASLGWLIYMDSVGTLVYIWPFETETALAMLSFFMMAVLLRKLFFKACEKSIPVFVKITLIITGTLLICVVMYMVSKRGGADTRSDLYRGFPYYLLGAWLGIIATLMFSLAFTGTGPGSVITYVGQRTLPILVMHKFPILFLRIVFPALRLNLDMGVKKFELVFALVILLLTLLMEKIISRYIPVVFGIRGKREIKVPLKKE